MIVASYLLIYSKCSGDLLQMIETSKYGSHTSLYDHVDWADRL